MFHQVVLQLPGCLLSLTMSDVKALAIRKEHLRLRPLFFHLFLLCSCCCCQWPGACRDRCDSPCRDQGCSQGLWLTSNTGQQAKKTPLEHRPAAHPHLFITPLFLSGDKQVMYVLRKRERNLLFLCVCETAECLSVSRHTLLTAGGHFQCLFRQTELLGYSLNNDIMMVLRKLIA